MLEIIVKYFVRSKRNEKTKQKIDDQRDCLVERGCEINIQTLNYDDVFSPEDKSKSQCAKVPSSGLVSVKNDVEAVDSFDKKIVFSNAFQNALQQATNFASEQNRDLEISVSTSNSQNQNIDVMNDIKSTDHTCSSGKITSSMEYSNQKINTIAAANENHIELFVSDVECSGKISFLIVFVVVILRAKTIVYKESLKLITVKSSQNLVMNQKCN